MAGINPEQVYLPSPDQSKTTGAVAVAPIGTTAPTDARTALANTWASGGYIDENGIALSISKSFTTIKDWAMSSVRKALTDFDGTIALSFLQVDEFAAQRVLGTANVTKTAANTTHGEQLKLSVGPDVAPAESWCFSMKDGNRRVRVYIPNGQITEISGDVSFTPGAANVWPCTLSCYDDGTGHSIYVFYDDGVVSA